MERPIRFAAVGNASNKNTLSLRQAQTDSHRVPQGYRSAFLTSSENNDNDPE